MYIPNFRDPTAPEIPAIKDDDKVVEVNQVKDVDVRKLNKRNKLGV